MLVDLVIDSFKSYAHASVSLRPLTVIIGPNGSGKTSVLQALEFLGALTRESLPQHLEDRGWDYADLPHLRATSKQFGFTSTLEIEGQRYEWLLQFGARRNAGIAAEYVRRLGDGRELMVRRGRTMSRIDTRTGESERVVQTLTSSWLGTLASEDAERYPELLALARWARGVQNYVALEPARLREPSRRTDEIGPHGQNLAGYLTSLRDRKPTQFKAVVKRVKRAYPHLVDLRIKSGSYGWNRLEVTERWGGETVTLNAKQVSDGLLRLLAVSAMHELSSAPTIVMFDEVENGVHPHLLNALMTMLKSLSRQRGTQVVVTTHSPIALNHVGEPEGVLVATRKSTGEASLTPISETAGFRNLGRYFDLGELWYNLGERDLLRRPRKQKSGTA